jgi:hypothetical protein
MSARRTARARPSRESDLLIDRAASSKRAQTPVTCGAAIDVPLIRT